jgi:hypothetical protein
MWSRDGSLANQMSWFLFLFINFASRFIPRANLGVDLLNLPSFTVIYSHEVVEFNPLTDYVFQDSHLQMLRL